jgi:hypothetical protein
MEDTSLSPDGGTSFRPGTPEELFRLTGEIKRDFMRWRAVALALGEGDLVDVPNERLGNLMRQAVYFITVGPALEARIDGIGRDLAQRNVATGLFRRPRLGPGVGEPPSLLEAVRDDLEKLEFVFRETRAAYSEGTLAVRVAAVFALVGERILEAPEPGATSPDL